MKKKPWIALGMSIGMPGLGQIYLGQGERGAFLYLFPNLVVLLCFLFTNALGVMLGLLFLFVVYFYACVTAYYDAKADPEPKPPKFYNHPMVYLLLWMMHLGFTTWLTNPNSSLGKHVVIRAFKARSVAMEPAILRGDLIFTFKRPYRQQHLKPGDLVVVQEPPPENRYQIRRILGLPGDTIEIDGGEVIRNGERLSLDFGADPPAYIRSGYTYFVENQSDRSYYVSHQVGASHRDGSWTLPENQYFVLADRRFQFTDSTLWGPLHDDRIIGEVAFIIWPRGAMKRFGLVSYDKPRVGKDVTPVGKGSKN